MELQIIKIHEKGKPNEEFIEFFVKESCNLSLYILTDTTYKTNQNISNKLRNTYWFPDYNVSKGDCIILYTGTYNRSPHKNFLGSYTHYFAWELERTVWNNDKDCAVLFKIDEWVKSNYEPKAKQVLKYFNN